MKWSNVLMVFFSVSWGFSSQGMDQPSDPFNMPSGIYSDLGQSFFNPSEKQALQTSSIEEAFQELTKRSFLDFYEGINRYIQYSVNRDEEAQRELGDAQNALRLSIDYKPLLEAPVFKSFLDSSNLREIDKVKRALNGSYFGKHPQDLCKAIPYFLRNIDKNNEETINDANRVLDKLAQGSRANVADINIIKQKIAEVTKTSPRLKDQNIKECMLLLKETCNFFPKKAFQKALHDLTDVQLFSLLNYKPVENFQQTVIEPIINNIDGMISFISTQKVSEVNKRISDLEDIKKVIIETSGAQKAFSFEQVNQWIRKVEYIAEVTLNPDPLKTSTLQLEELEEKRKKEEEAQQESVRQKEQADLKKWLNDPETNLVQDSQKLLDYMKQEEWDNQTKVYALQMLFWKAHKDGMVARQVEIAQQLYELEASPPHIVHQRGIIIDKIPHSVSYPKFTFSVKNLPSGAPIALKNLFEQTNKEILEVQSKEPKFAIKNYYEDIQDLKKSWTKQDIQEAAQKAEAFHSKYELEKKEKSSEEIERELKEEFEREERYPEQKLVTKPFLHKTEFTPSELAEMRTKAEMSAEEQQKFVEKRKKFVVERTEEKKPIREKFSLTESEQRIQEKIQSSIARKQEEMEKLIEKQVALLEEKINENPSAATLADIKKELEEYKIYVSPDSKKLLDIIQKNIDSLTTAAEKEENTKKIDVLLKKLETSISGSLKNPSIFESVRNISTPRLIGIIKDSFVPRQISQARKLLTDLNQEQKELLDKIKETIEKNVIGAIKKGYRDSGLNYLLSYDRYKNFPDDTSLASLFELTEFPGSNLFNQKDILDALTNIIKSSIDPEKIESNKLEIGKIIERIKNYKAEIEKKIEEQARIAQEAEEVRLTEQAKLAELAAEAAERKRQEEQRIAEAAAAAEEQERKRKEDERQQAVANRLAAQIRKVQEQAAQLPPEQQKQLKEEIIPAMLEAVDPNVGRIFAPSVIEQPALITPAPIAGPGEPAVSIEEPESTQRDFFQTYSPVRRLWQGIKDTFNNARSWFNSWWYGG